MPSSVVNLFLVGGLWFCLVFFCSGRNSSQTHKVTYRVDGEGPASVTYANATEGTEQRNVTLPWTETFTASHGQFLYVSAQDKGGIGLIVCSISVDGKIVKDATSKGEFTIATVSDRCCGE